MGIARNRKDIDYRKNFKKVEITRNMYKMLIRNEEISNKMKVMYNEQLSKISRVGSICKIKNRCILTGRARGIVSEYRVSRMKFRELMKLGLITGVRKLSY